MKSTRKPSHGEALSRAQERTRVLSLEAVVRDLLALERLRIESRERLELASMKEARAADDRRARWYDVLAQALPEALARFSTLVSTGSPVGQVGHGVTLVRPASSPEPAPAPAPAPASASAPASTGPLDDDVDPVEENGEAIELATEGEPLQIHVTAPPANDLAPESKSEPVPPAPAVANGVSPGHPLGHIYGNGVAGH